jgi:hypothetical protein
MAVASYGAAATLCRGDLRCVTLGDLRRAHRVYAAYLDDRPVGLFTCSERGQGAWLNGYPEHLAAVCAAIARVMAEEFGACWGAMENPQLRAAIVAAGNGQITDEAGVLRWVG